MNTAIQLLTLAIVLATAAIYWGQLRTMRDASQGESFLALVRILQDPAIRAAREHLREAHETLPFEAWPQETVREAAKVCQSFDVAGMMIHYKMVPAELVADWQWAILRCWEAAKPVVNRRREDANPYGWRHFEWLANQAERMQLGPVQQKRLR